MKEDFSCSSSCPGYVSKIRDGKGESMGLLLFLFCLLKKFFFQNVLCMNHFHSFPYVAFPLGFNLCIFFLFYCEEGLLAWGWRDSIFAPYNFVETCVALKLLCGDLIYFSTTRSFSSDKVFCQGRQVKPCRRAGAFPFWISFYWYYAQTLLISLVCDNGWDLFCVYVSQEKEVIGKLVSFTFCWSITSI